MWSTRPLQAQDIAGKMLGQTLVTHQTGPEGKLVSKVLDRQSGGHQQGIVSGGAF